MRMSFVLMACMRAYIAILGRPASPPDSPRSLVDDFARRGAPRTGHGSEWIPGAVAAFREADAEGSQPPEPECKAGEQRGGHNAAGSRG
jgi:hypothetical protein